MSWYGPLPCNCNCVPSCCETVMGECSFEWQCLTSVHKVRLARYISDIEAILFTTELHEGIWIPPITHAQPTRYEIQVCCDDPGIGECEWQTVGTKTLNGTSSCPTCTVDPWDECEKVVTEGEPRANLTVVVAINSNTLTCLCGGVNSTTTDWSGLYVINPTTSGTQCIGSLTVNSPTGTCTGNYTAVDQLTINYDTLSVTVKFQTIIYFNGSPLAGRFITHTYILGTTTELLYPGYLDCQGYLLGEAAAASFDFSSSSAGVVFGLGDPGTCYYPSSYNPVVSVSRQ